jgi:hypothetical protein
VNQVAQKRRFDDDSTVGTHFLTAITAYAAGIIKLGRHCLIPLRKLQSLGVNRAYLHTGTANGAFVFENNRTGRHIILDEA